jgi:PKD domain
MMLVHGRRIARKTTVALATAGLLSLVTAPLLTSSASALPSNPLSPANGTYFGAAVPDVAGVTNQDETLAYEGAIGRKLDLERVYKRFDENMVSDAMRWDRDNNRNLIVSVNSVTSSGSPVKWADVAAGRYDSVIAAHADDIKAFGAPIWLSFNHEPEDDVAAGGAADFVAAWKHYVDIFRARGVTNVSWTWIMMAYSFRPGSGVRAPAFYPGDDYVDFVAADGYNWYNCGGRNADWAPFQNIFNDFHTFGVTHNKPEIVAEYGSSEDPILPGRKAQWLADAATSVAAWPEIKAVSYWGPGDCFDINSSPSSIQAFASMGAQGNLHVRPTAALTDSGESGATPLAVSFDGSASQSPRGSLAAWSFDPGDGAAIVRANGMPPASLPHTYLAPGSSPVSYSATLSVRDVDGQWDWQTRQVTVSPAPVVTTNAGNTAGVTTVGVTGRVDTNGLATEYSVQYGTTTAYASQTASAGLPGGDRPVAVSVTMSALAPVTTYHYRVVGRNAAGTGYGADRTVTTKGAPTAASYGAGDLSVGGATVRGAVDANGLATDYRVAYGTTTGYGTATNWTAGGDASYSKSVAVVLRGLAGSTTYHYRVEGSNSAGTGVSADRTFVSAGVPAARTDGAGGLTASTAQLNGWVDSNQIATTFSFQYGVTVGYGSATSSAPTRVAWGARVPATSVTGLRSRTTYHYRIVASNAAGRTYGADRTFTTS